MNGLIALSETRDEQDVLPNMPPYPAIGLDHARQSLRLDGTVTDVRLRNAVAGAIIHVNADLAAWMDERQRTGETSGLSAEQETLYRDAVHAVAAAKLGELYRGFDATGEGHKAADAVQEAIDRHWRNARWAVRDIMGQAHVTVELI